MRPTRYTKGIGERTLDAIWAIICVKPAIVNTVEYIADWKYKNREDMKRNAIVAGCVLAIFATVGTIAYTIANTGNSSEYDKGMQMSKDSIVETNRAIEESNKFLRNYEQRQREREVLEKGSRDLMSDLRSQYGR